MDWENLIEESVVDFIKEQVQASNVQVEDLTLELGVAEAPGGNSTFFLGEIEFEDGEEQEFELFTHSSGLRFSIHKQNVSLFDNLVLKTAQVATEEGIHTVVTFVPRLGVDFSEESDNIEE